MAKAGLAQEVKERPILFSGPMVRAILEGRKTQTRRVVKPHPWVARDTSDLDIPHMLAHCPYGKPGERLWVREKWGTDFNARFHEEHGLSAPDYVVDANGEPAVLYAADRNFPMVIDEEFIAEHDHVAWKPSIHMRRAASRITLELTDVRVERLQDIWGEDARAEGINPDGLNADTTAIRHTLLKGSLAVDRFARLWDSINAARGFGWDKNPWVFVLTFRRLTQDAGA